MRTLKYSWTQIITFVLLFIVLSGCLVTNESNEKVYVVLAIYIILFIPILCSEKITIIRYPVLISGIMLLVWAYGFLIGLLRGNNVSYIIRNFAGMSAYILVVPFLNSKVSNIQFIKIVRVVSTYALFITIFTYVMLTFFHLEFLYEIPVINAFVGGGGKGGFVQYFCRELIPITFAYNLYSALKTKKNIVRAVVIIVLVVLETMLVNDSSADALAIGVLAVLIVASRAKYLNRRTIFFCMIGIAFLFVFIIVYGQDPLSAIFSTEDEGNVRRITEIKYFMNHMTFMGYGLGKELGDAGAGGSFNYGTEVIYLNLFHKFGICAFLILSCYTSTCINAIRYLKKCDEPNGVIPIALMAYLIASLSNPMLFSGASVIQHIIALIIISRNSPSEKML